jgi:hypothetical protein
MVLVVLTQGSGPRNRAFPSNKRLFELLQPAVIGNINQTESPLR